MVATILYLNTDPSAHIPQMTLAGMRRYAFTRGWTVEAYPAAESRKNRLAAHRDEHSRPMRLPVGRRPDYGQGDPRGSVQNPPPHTWVVWRCGDGASPSRDDGGVVATSNAKSRWLELEGRAGENAWLLRFDLLPRLVDWSASDAEDLPPSPQDGNDEIPEYTVHFMEWYTPDMAGLSRREPAMRVLRGPLVLAKGRLAGTSREETLFASSRAGQWFSWPRFICQTYGFAF